MSLTQEHHNSTAPDAERSGLRRSLTLPWLVFYGVGITVGAGIFALIGELLTVSGARAPLAFLLAGTIAGITSLSYRDLVARMPRAGGEAVWVSRGIGPAVGRVAGIAVVIAGIVSSAVVALAFGGYVAEVLNVNATVISVIAVVGLVGVAAYGTRESIALGAVVTILEVGTLALIIVLGVPLLASWDAVAVIFDADTTLETTSGLSPILAGTVVAFFAFIGFEDIVNMAEETVDPQRTAPRAIAWTLVLSVLVYLLLAMIAVNIDDPRMVADSDAPMATLFEVLSGRRPEAIATIAAIAMTNGILAQLMMSARVIFGMASDNALGPASRPFRQVHRTRQTPLAATVAVGAVVALLVVAVPLVRLARLTSLIILFVFTLVNVSQVRIARHEPGPGRKLWHGSVGAVICGALFVWEAVNAVGELA